MRAVTRLIVRVPDLALATNADSLIEFLRDLALLDALPLGVANTSGAGTADFSGL
jgi:hypothetical protein